MSSSSSSSTSSSSSSTSSSFSDDVEMAAWRRIVLDEALAKVEFARAERHRAETRVAEQSAQLEMTRAAVAAARALVESAEKHLAVTQRIVGGADARRPRSPRAPAAARKRRRSNSDDGAVARPHKRRKPLQRVSDADLSTVRTRLMQHVADAIAATNGTEYAVFMHITTAIANQSQVHVRPRYIREFISGARQNAQPQASKVWAIDAYLSSPSAAALVARAEPSKAEAASCSKS